MIAFETLKKHAQKVVLMYPQDCHSMEMIGHPKGPRVTWGKTWTWIHWMHSLELLLPLKGFSD
jgi:hypothetical protein